MAITAAEGKKKDEYIEQIGNTTKWYIERNREMTEENK